MDIEELVAKLKGVLPAGFELLTGPRGIPPHPREIEFRVRHGVKLVAFDIPVVHTVDPQQAEDLINDVKRFVEIEGRKMGAVSQ